MAQVAGSITGSAERELLTPGLMEPPAYRYPALLQDYVTSEHGIHHQQQPLRYEAGFGSYGRESMLADLGVDIHPVGHMPATARTFVSLASSEKTLSTEEVKLGKSAALVHDLGECTLPSLVEACGAVVGDIPQGRKTDEQRAVEQRVWNHLIGLYFSDKLSEQQVDRIRLLITHQEDSPLHHTLEANHDTNTFLAGSWAGWLALAELEWGETDNKRFEVLRSLGKAVTSGILPRVTRHADGFAHTRRILEQSEPLYYRIQTEL